MPDIMAAMMGWYGGTVCRRLRRIGGELLFVVGPYLSWPDRAKLKAVGELDWIVDLACKHLVEAIAQIGEVDLRRAVSLVVERVAVTGVEVDETGDGFRVAASDGRAAERVADEHGARLSWVFQMKGCENGEHVVTETVRGIGWYRSARVWRTLRSRDE